MIIFIFMFLMVSTLLCVLFATRSPTATVNLKKRVRSIQPGDVALQAATGPVRLMVNAKKLRPAQIKAVSSKSESIRKLELLILQTGLAVSVQQLVLWSVASGLVVGAVLFLMSRLALAPIVGFGAGVTLPIFALRFMRTRRVNKFNAALPESIDLMARSLRAGHSVSSALEIISDQGIEPLSGEFKQVAQQQQLGAMFRDTLLQLAERVPSQDLHFLITAMMIQRENGGDLTQVLDRTSNVIAERLRIAAEVRTYSAQGRLTGWILSALPVVLLFIINLINPGYSKALFEEPTGRLMLYGAATSIGIGILIIRKIVNIKV